MVDEQQADPDKSRETTAPAPAAPQGDDWGSDWESAFQAEEFLVDEAGGDPALTEAVQIGSDDFMPADEDSRGDLGHDAGEAEPGAAVDATGQPATMAKGPGPAARLMVRCLALPMTVLLAVPAALLLLLAGTILFRPLERPVLTTPAPTQHAAAPTAPTAPTAPAVPTASLPEQAPTPADSVPPQVEKKLATWPFTAFIIPVVDEETRAAIFVTVELALVIALDNEKDSPPLTKKPIVRDTIFQFFVNRPLYDLRRYDLAHDEMSAQLLDWLRMQWPEGEIKAVTVTSYKLD